MFGTNCGNCKFFTGRTVHNTHEDQNSQGGLVIAKSDLDNAKRGDLITLPGSASPTAGAVCTHPKIAMPVNNRMCCAYWDNSGAYRQWKDK